MDWWQLVGLAFIAWFVLVLLFTPRIDYQVTVPLRTVTSISLDVPRSSK